MSHAWAGAPGEAAQQMQNFFKPKVSHGPSRPTENLNVRLQCKNCRDEVPNVIEDFAQGDLICGNCGLVMGNRIIDTRSEWRSFSNDEGGADPSRIGAVSDPLLGGNTMSSTIIGAMDGGSGASNEYNRTHGRITNQSKENSMIKAFKEIETMCQRIGLNKLVQDSAKQLFKKVDDEKLLKGKSSDAIIAACIYIGCREQNLARTFKEICALTKVSKKEIGRCYKLLQPFFETPVQSVGMDVYISRFASNLDLKKDVEKASLKLCNMVNEIGILAGKSPISIVAACIYMVSSLSSEPAAAKEIADTAGCTEGTLKNAYKTLFLNRTRLQAAVDKEKFDFSLISES